VKTTENSLPTEAMGFDTTARSSANVSSRRVLRVWVVDDSADLRVLFAQLLTKQPGIQCRRQFPSAEAVLATLAEERPPDVILLDINLGGQSGLSAIRPIKKLAPSVKVLMLTMFSNSHYEAAAYKSGASGCLLKSYELDVIARLIHEAYSHPDAAGLFPTMALYEEAELSLKQTDARDSSRRFSLVGALRQLRGAPRRQTAS
jgi:DNA-binding NarL/FixJ family response regulator